jgi:4a-hydroxytetrahydrobiopterin dehydratase
MQLAKRQCEPCRAGTTPLNEAECAELMVELIDWTIEDGRLIKSIKMSGFMQPMNLANKIAALAESVSHHPDLLIRWGELKITIWTHTINGLSIADFILAARIDELIL